MDYVVRTEFDCNLTGDVFLTPFEIFNLHLTITVNTIVLEPKHNNGRNVHIKFNCMSSDLVSTIDSAPNLEYGTYALASYFLDSDYTNASNHRFNHISVLHPDDKITIKEKKKDKAKDYEKEKEIELK